MVATVCVEGLVGRIGLHPLPLQLRPCVVLHMHLATLDVSRPPPPPPREPPAARAGRSTRPKTKEVGAQESTHESTTARRVHICVFWID